MINTESSKIFNTIICASAFIFLFGCKSEQKLTAGQGYIKVKGGRVWYRIDGGGSNTPVLLLHGGPGGSSYHLNILKPLSADHPLIYLDQLGGGKSDRITDTSLMTIGNYIHELRQFCRKLGLKKYYLYGHSWGTMLGIDYYTKYPKGIKAIIFNSPLFSTAMWIKDADTLIATLPEYIQSDIRENEKNKTYNDPNYQYAMTEYYHHFMKRTPYASTAKDSSAGYFGENVYNYMWGPSEFTATGNLKDFDRLKYLPKIKVPVLFICGEYDEARPTTVKYYQSLVPGSKLVIIEGSGHATMMDNPGQNIKAIADFLNELEKK